MNASSIVEQTSFGHSPQSSKRADRAPSADHRKPENWPEIDFRWWSAALIAGGAVIGALAYALS